MTRVVGIDPGTVSFDLCGLAEGRVFLDASIPTTEFARDPATLINLLDSVRPVDLIAAPSGYGLPLVRIEEFGEQERFLFTLVDEYERGRIAVLGGMGKMISLMKASGLPFIFLPGVIHLPTVPEHRKVNKIDMGTTDKLCCLALGIYDQAHRYRIGYHETSFIYVEVGGAYTAVMAVDEGRVVDGLGGTSNGTGYYSLGSMDGELAYLLGGFPKQTLFTGGVAYIAGRPELSPEDLVILAESDERARMAWEALLEGVCKAVAAERVVVPHAREILISGRLCRVEKIHQELVKRLAPFGPARRVQGFASVAKEAAQGAALIAEGLAGGQYRELVEVMEIHKARGTVLDYLYIQGAEALRQKVLG